MASLPFRWVAVLALAALAPVGAFYLGRGEAVVALSAVCVALIVASVYVMLGSPDVAAH